MLEMELYEIRIDELNWRQPQIIILKEKGGNRELPIVIGLFEAQSIYIKINNIQTYRPFTHDLITNIINQFGGKLERIVIDELKSDTFYAKLSIKTGNGKELIIDSRPSDAIALAMRNHCPIYINEDILEQINLEE